jgi:hypothetical protein
LTATEQFIDVLKTLKAGDRKLLRNHAGLGLDQSIQGFDLFAGIWWPLRQSSPKVPRREVAWLVAKMFASYPIPHFPKETLACQLKKCLPARTQDNNRFAQRFDRLLVLPLNQIESALQWALKCIADLKYPKLDWVKLTDDLSIWERDATRLEWANQFLQFTKGDSDVNRDSHDSKPQPIQPEPG